MKQRSQQGSAKGGKGSRQRRGGRMDYVEMAANVVSCVSYLSPILQ